jgi:hypothetical protein
MGIHKAEKSMSSKVLVWPAIVIKAPADPVEPDAFAQDAAETAAYPFADEREGPFATMLEALEPSPQSTIYVVDDDGKAAAVAGV